MDEIYWFAWPWISLLIFAYLVRSILLPIRWHPLNPYAAGPGEGEMGGVGALVIISVIVGAAICVLIRALLQ